MGVHTILRTPSAGMIQLLRVSPRSFGATHAPATTSRPPGFRMRSHSSSALLVSKEAHPSDRACRCYAAIPSPHGFTSSYPARIRSCLPVVIEKHHAHAAGDDVTTRVAKVGCQVLRISNLRAAKTTIKCYILSFIRKGIPHGMMLVSATASMRRSSDEQRTGNCARHSPAHAAALPQSCRAQCQWRPHRSAAGLWQSTELVRLNLTPHRAPLRLHRWHSTSSARFRQCI